MEPLFPFVSFWWQADSVVVRWKFRWVRVNLFNNILVQCFRRLGNWRKYVSEIIGVFFYVLNHFVHDLRPKYSVSKMRTRRKINGKKPPNYIQTKPTFQWKQLRRQLSVAIPRPERNFVTLTRRKRRQLFLFAQFAMRLVQLKYFSLWLAAAWKGAKVLWVSKIQRFGATFWFQSAHLSLVQCYHLCLINWLVGCCNIPLKGDVRSSSLIASPCSLLCQW